MNKSKYIVGSKPSLDLDVKMVNNLMADDSVQLAFQSVLEETMPYVNRTYAFKSQKKITSKSLKNVSSVTI